MKYVKIVAQGSGKVLDAAMSDATVILWEDNGGDNQLWYMDEAPELQDKLPHSQIPPLIRNKKFSELVSQLWLEQSQGLPLLRIPNRYSLQLPGECKRQELSNEPPLHY